MSDVDDVRPDIYRKPDLYLLGNAFDSILGRKTINSEPTPCQGLKDIVADSELDD
jgi:hypothetical protein